MSKVFDKMGVRFEYPDEWQIDTKELQESSNSITIYGPQDCFWSLQINPQEVSPKEMVEQALQVMRDEYEDVEAEAFQETFDHLEVLGYDMTFYCLDLTNTAQVRAFRDEVASYVVFCQAEDRDFEEAEPVFAAITLALLSNESENDDANE